MTEPSPGSDSLATREDVTRVTDQLVQHIGSIDDAAGLEWVAAKLGLAIGDPAAPPGVAEAIVASLEAREGTEGARILAAIAQVCPGRAAKAADAAVKGLSRRGVEYELPVGLGQHELGRAQVERRSDRDLYSVLLRRPGVELVELGSFSTRRGEWSGVLHEGVLSRPLSEGDAERILKRINDQAGRRGGCEPVSGPDLATALRTAFARTAELEGNAQFELWFVLAALAQALDMDPETLPASHIEPRRG